MASFVVMEPPSGVRDGQAVLVRDGFHFLAFLAPPLWLFWHRLWIEGAAALALLAALGAFGSAPQLAGDTVANAAPYLSLLVSIYFGLEGAALRVRALDRRGWRPWGVVEADDIADAETRYLSETTRGEAAALSGTDDFPRKAGTRREGEGTDLFNFPAGA